MLTFTYEGDQFLMNGKPYRILSGAMHYFRIVPEYWEDRLKKLKACGFNTVETYTCWNLHERKEGQFDFSGILDLERYITLAENLGLNVIVRPGPYICSEFEFGGLPSWLLKYPNMGLRCNDPQYLEKVRPFYKELFDRIRPHLCTNGGRVIMLQVENEYGSYGDDKDYLRAVETIYRENGIDCLLFTSDGSEHWMLSGGTLPHMLKVVNFGSHPTENFDKLKAFGHDGPLMCGEFWCGWFDHWYEEHHTRTPEDVAADTRELLEYGASINYYMLHGGTNFGFTNGANYHQGYEPTVTSYDYCSPISECGDLTPTFYAVKQVLEEVTGKKAPEMDVADLPKAAYGDVTLTQSAALFENLPQSIPSAIPQTMEDLGQDFGYLLYSTTLRGPFAPLKLEYGKVHDRAIIFVNGKRMGLWERSRVHDEITLSLAAGETARLDILLENMGRVNYGPKLFDRKGILDGIRLGQRFHFGWDHYCLTMDDLSGLQWQNAKPWEGQPMFMKGSLEISGTPADTFLELKGFTKGFVTVNGFNIGRYFNSAGPQRTLYIPAPLLKTGSNDIIVFETDSFEKPVITFRDTPDLG